MKQTLNLQSDYSAIENGYQLWIPLDCSIRIPEDDPVRLLNAVAERMDYREIEAAYSRYGRIEYSPKMNNCSLQAPSFAMELLLITIRQGYKKSPEIRRVQSVTESHKTDINELVFRWLLSLLVSLSWLIQKR